MGSNKAVEILTVNHMTLTQGQNYTFNTSI